MLFPFSPFSRKYLPYVPEQAKHLLYVLEQAKHLLYVREQSKPLPYVREQANKLLRVICRMYVNKLSSGPYVLEQADSCRMYESKQTVAVYTRAIKQLLPEFELEFELWGGRFGVVQLTGSTLLTTVELRGASETALVKEENPRTKFGEIPNPK